MHVERVRFDRVFDVQERLKEFSFEDRGRPVYGVRALGLGIPREGATYAVAFLESGNWETVVVMLASIVHGARGLLRNRRADSAPRDAIFVTTTEIMA